MMGFIRRWFGRGVPSLDLRGLNADWQIGDIAEFVGHGEVSFLPMENGFVPRLGGRYLVVGVFNGSNVDGSLAATALQFPGTGGRGWPSVGFRKVKPPAVERTVPRAVRKPEPVA